MYVNLHNLPADKAMYTLYVAPHALSLEETEEYDVVAPARSTEISYRTSIAITEAKERLVELYGPTVEVRGAVDQSAGEVIFDSRQRGYRPIPVVPSERLAAWESPYDTFINLCIDEHDNLGTGEYLDWLAADCPACGEPIDYCQGHGEIGDPAGAAILVAHDEGDHSRCRHPQEG